jgi:peptidoglycan/LPS O-acetylase OafA/YrhL
MGAIRTLLALFVVVIHAGGEDFFLSPVGVGLQLFYMISGFFISYALATTARYSDARVFYWSRALRLFPVYYAVLLLTLVARAFAPHHSLFELYRDLPASADGLLAASNLIMLGQDWLKFMAIEGGRLVFSANTASSEYPLSAGVLVPQAWTLGVELSFYLLAPFVLRDRKRIVILLLASLALRAALAIQGIARHDPWTHAFFPMELSLFLFGALSHQVLLPKWRALVESGSRPWLPAAGTALLVVLQFAYIALPGDSVLKGMGLLAAFVPLLPLAFLFQNACWLDRAIGDLSYPIYIGHFLVISVMAVVAHRLAIESALLVVILDVVLAIGFAILLNMLVAGKVEAYRRSLKQRAAQSQNHAMDESGYTAPVV